MNEEITESYIRFLVSKNLKWLRESQNYSQLGLAEDADLSSNFINNIENCEKSASLETIAKLSTALKVAPHMFFMPEDAPDNAQIYMNAFKEDIQRYVNNWTEPYLPPEREKKR